MLSGPLDIVNDEKSIEDHRNSQIVTLTENLNVFSALRSNYRLTVTLSRASESRERVRAHTRLKEHDRGNVNDNNRTNEHLPPLNIVRTMCTDIYRDSC